MDVLVYIECADGKAVGGSFEALSAGASTGASVNAVLIGSGLDDAAAAIAACGPAAVTVVDTDNALLICSKENAGGIRRVLETLKAEKREDLL